MREQHNSKDTAEFRDAYRDYTMGLAIFDHLPVLLFLLSGLIIYSMYSSPLLLAGVLACFAGGSGKAAWKIIVVRQHRDLAILTRAFHILMPTGFVLMLLAVLTGGKAAIGGFWRSITMMPAALLFAAGLVLMCLMGYLGAHLDSSARSNWIEEAVNTIAQLAVLIGVIMVYFGAYYHADPTALKALEGSDTVNVTELAQETDSMDGWLFDGPGTDAALVFYPGAKVEAAAYAPVMKSVAEGGVDCYLCKMPLNFALLGKNTADKIRAEYEAAADTRTDGTNAYKKWYIGGHSLGGATAAMAADSAEDAGGDAVWDGLILLAAYPTDMLTTPVLSIYGSEDSVLSLDKYKRAADDRLWPDDFTEKIIEGGNHAHFGDYGEQKGDRAASISLTEQQKQTCEAILNWVY